MVQDCEPLDLQHPSPSTIAEVLILQSSSYSVELSCGFYRKLGKINIFILSLLSTVKTLLKGNYYLTEIVNFVITMYRFGTHFNFMMM